MNKINISPIGKIVNGNEVKVILDPKYAKALKGLEGYSHVQILWWMNGSDNQRDRNVLVEKKPYKNGPDEIGVFALRSPERPNPIAVSNVNIAYVDEESGTVGLYYIDAFDGSQVLDLKPYEVDVRNVASCRILEKCGYTKEGHIRQGKMVNTWCDYYIYRVN